MESWLIDIHTPWLAGILVFLLAHFIATVCIVNKKKKSLRPQQLVSLYMLLKGTKIVLFLMIVIIYALAVKIETARFVLTAVALYCVFLLADTLFLTSVEKELKKNEKK